MSFLVPSFARRVHFQERMDDPSASPEQFARALRELRAVNRLLGGHRALRKQIEPFLASRRGTRVSIVDLGTGLADYPEVLVRWGNELGVEVHVAAVDANKSVVDCANTYLSESLPPQLRSRTTVRQGDARALPYPDKHFHLATASLFLHHFDDEECAAVLQEMDRVASHGLVINDLHRHPLAYVGIHSIATVLPVSEMFAHDGPLSVRRAFKPAELRRLASDVGLAGARIEWHWAFRLTLSTVR